MNATKITYSLDQIAESPYVLGTRKQDKFKVIDVQLPVDWEIPAKIFPKDSKVFVDNGTMPQMFMFFTEELNFSDIYSIIEKTVRYNKEKEDKIVILNKLQVQLQKQFDELPLELFKLLYITTAPESVKRTAPPVPSPPPARIITEGKEPPKAPTDGTIPKP